MDKIKTVTVKQLSRFPVYLRYLKSIRDLGETQTSAPLIAKNLGLNEEQVRKDLQVVSSSDGKPKSGRVVEDLINDIETFLGYNDVNDAVIIGTGHLGNALLNYRGFNDLGLNILVGFDNNPNVIGKQINGKMIYSIDKMENLIPRLNVQIAILTVPVTEAQAIVNVLVKIGIKAIWNFVPIHLEVPDSIVVENVNLASSLAVLSHKLKDSEQGNK
jgi:redox-sensing transcriptional repressor